MKRYPAQTPTHIPKEGMKSLAEIDTLLGVSAYFLFLYFMFDKIETVQNVLLIASSVFAGAMVLKFITVFLKKNNGRNSKINNLRAMLNYTDSIGSGKFFWVSPAFVLAFILLFIQKGTTEGIWFLWVLALMYAAIILSNAVTYCKNKKQLNLNNQKAEKV